MQYRIATATAHPDFRVSITWSDGIAATVDLAPALAKGVVFAHMRDPAYFATNMRIADDRLGIEWPNRVDFSADGLRYRAFPEEAEGEFGFLPEPAGSI